MKHHVHKSRASPKPLNSFKYLRVDLFFN